MAALLHSLLTIIRNSETMSRPTHRADEKLVLQKPLDSCQFRCASFPPLAKGGLGGVVPARPAPGTRFGAARTPGQETGSKPAPGRRFGSAGPAGLTLIAAREGAAYAQSTPPNPPFARGGKVASAAVRGATKTELERGSQHHGQGQIFISPRPHPNRFSIPVTLSQNLAVSITSHVVCLLGLGLLG
jgi:hypothetical protein